MAATSSRGCPFRDKDFLQSQVRELSRLLLGKTKGENIWNKKNAPEDWPASLTWKNPTSSPKDSMQELKDKFLYLRSKTGRLLSADQIRMYELFDGKNAKDLAGHVASDNFLKVCETFLNTEAKYVPLGKAKKITILLDAIICILKGKELMQTDIDREPAHDCILKSDNYEQTSHTFSKEFDTGTENFSPRFHEQDVKLKSNERESPMISENRKSPTGESLHFTKRKNSTAFENEPQNVKRCIRKKLQSTSIAGPSKNFCSQLLNGDNNNKLYTHINNKQSVDSSKQYANSALSTYINNLPDTGINNQSLKHNSKQLSMDIVRVPNNQLSEDIVRVLKNQLSADDIIQSSVDSNIIYVDSCIQLGNINGQLSMDFTSQSIKDSNSFTPINDHSPRDIGVVSTENQVEVMSIFFTQSVTDDHSFTPLSNQSSSDSDVGSIENQDEMMSDFFNQSVINSSSFISVTSQSSIDSDVGSIENQDEMMIFEEGLSSPSVSLLLEEITKKL